MQISTKTEYALRALSELALSQSDKPLSIAEICSKQYLPHKYVEQLFRKLKKSELVVSSHGAQGGYNLTKPASEISLKNIMQAVDENYLKNFCSDKTRAEHCLGTKCGFHQLWDEIRSDLETYFDSIKLDRIIAKLED